MATLADLVRQYRSDAQLSQEALAERAGVSTRTISDIECGVARAPRAITLSLLAEALELADAEKERLRATVRRTPPVPAAESVPFGLPSVPPRLIGREAESAAAADVLTREGTRLVTFLGGAGVGKTSLALSVAHAIGAQFAGGVLLVEMAAIPDPAFVPTKIAFAAQVRDARGESTAASIAAALRGRRTLLVLDTCEHIAGAAPFIAELLAAARGLTIAATSRVPVRLAMEIEFGLGPLPVPAAGSPASGVALAANPTVALLIDRVRQRQPAFALTEGNAADIAELACLLEGNPLAIALAAPLLVSSSPAALANQLQRRLPLLVATGADLPPRQRTMRDAIGWSYELLTDAERRIFRRLSVFRGSFGAELAHTVAGEAGHDVLETLRVVAVLVDQNLLQVLDADDGEPRFVFLDMVREYAAELLATGDESEATYLRLGQSALATAGLFRSGLPASQLRPQFESLARESATFDAVLTWARDTGHVELGLRLVVQLWDFWWFCGSYAQAAAWLDARLRADHRKRRGRR
jgi:predicted ATPase/transcriptional regulator with XRE-family HTH domain